ncbi:hypothetical protein [Nonomuraea sp. 10N515B]|uniref:hypothetical protein n=1 Tax=Nonomuraea sp. 10N515B TaxID=3457422 RepID=UPI003FCE26AC
MTETETGRAPWHKFNAPKALWDAFGRACASQGTDRAKELRAHLVAYTREHGDAEAMALLEQGLAEMAEIRSRQSPGRPRGSSKAARALRDGNRG